MDYVEIERRFVDAFRHAGLLKEAEAEELIASPTDEAEVGAEVTETIGQVTGKVEAAMRPDPEVTLINIFEHPDAHPYVLDLALLKQYGPEWFEWEPETIELRVVHDFNTPRISDLNMEKLQAVKTLHYVDGYWKSWQTFVACTMPLNGLFPDFNIMQIPTTAQCAMSVDIANRIRGDVVWSDELKLYVGVACRFDGILCAPNTLDFAEIDVTGLPIDCEEVKQRWPLVRRTGTVSGEESVETEQLRRLLLIDEAVQEERERLRKQLPLLLHG